VQAAATTSSLRHVVMIDPSEIMFKKCHNGRDEYCLRGRMSSK
jgi:hypothetical protein